MSDLRSYLGLLRKNGELKSIKRKVSTKYEIAGVTSKAENSYALLFEKVSGKKFKIVSNLVGTRRRFALAVGAKENEIHQKVISSIERAKKPKKISRGKFMENQS